MDIFEILADYHADKPLTKEEMEENQKYILNHPLFMKELPQDIESNEHLSALMKLKEDQDPNETAENLNKQANKRLKQNPELLYNMKQAYKKYTQAINLKCSNTSINAKLHANRAQINLKLKNYGKVLTDCRLCIQYDPNYVKGYFRYAKALIILQKYDDCIKLLESRNQQELKQLLKEAKNKREKKIAEQNKKIIKKQETQNEIFKYCEKKGWKFLKRLQPLPEGVKASIVEGSLSVPLVIIYPQFGEFDLVASTFENDKIKQHIKQIIEAGLPWDLNKQYNMDDIQIYCQLSEAVLLRVPKQAKVGDLLSRVPIRQALQVQIVRKDNNFYKNYIPQHKII